MNKLLLIALLALSANVFSQTYQSYKWQSIDGNKVQLLRNYNAPLFQIANNSLEVLFPDLTIHKYRFKRMKGKYEIYSNGKN